MVRRGSASTAGPIEVAEREVCVRTDEQRSFVMALDHAVREQLLRALASRLPAPVGDALAHARRVLVLRHDRLGDMLSTLGLLRALASRGLEVDVLASDENAVLLDHAPWVSRTIVAPAGVSGVLQLRPRLRARRYDAVVDALVLKPAVNSRTALLMAASGARIRAGIDGRRHDFLYTHRVRPPADDANHVEYLAELAALFTGERGMALEPTPFPISDEESRGAAAWWSTLGRGRRLLVNISAGTADRRWPIDRFLAVLTRVRSDHPGTRVVISSAPGDRSSAQALASAVGATLLAMPLRSAFAVVGTADVVLTPDTSIAHIAAGFQRPAIVLIARRQLQFAPWRGVGHLVISDATNLDDIGVDDIANPLNDLLG